ncbi:hypothetical protein LTR62_000277 [Meristemomyces frigidus]|uniref:Amino acid permease n=1 Tax=Meristemomyces frigidus TaxID=1508187 RepID=A0AAN7YUR0_9PEZI|nr:hypothetical protein LTR62_000277 [Meristemomyces frigidus]
MTVSEFAPASWEQPLSCIVGWMAFLVWVASVPACTQVMTQMVQGMALIGNPNANVLELWQATLTIFMFLVLTFAFNIFLAKYLPLVEGIMVTSCIARLACHGSFASQYGAQLVIHVVAFVTFLILLWVMVDHPPADVVFSHFYDGGEWVSFGLATLVGISTPLWGFVGPDAGAHMSEEPKDASLQLPRAMMWATFFNGVMGIPMLITFCFCISSIDDVVHSASGQPIMDFIYAATGSYAATRVLGTLLLVLYFFGACNVLAAASRQDGGFPYSAWFSKVKKGQALNAVYLCAIISFVLAVINFGWTVALSAIISVSNAALIFSYIVSVGRIAIKRIRGEPLLARRWDLGWMGLPINLVSLAFLLVSFVFSL